MGVAERGAAMRALAPDVEARRLQRLPGFPVRPLHRPWDDVLEAAEDRAPVTGVLAEPVAVVGLDCVSAPGAAQRFRVSPLG